jgi:hypothetical protein
MKWQRGKRSRSRVAKVFTDLPIRVGWKGHQSSRYIAKKSERRRARSAMLANEACLRVAVVVWGGFMNYCQTTVKQPQFFTQGLIKSYVLPANCYKKSDETRIRIGDTMIFSLGRKVSSRCL